MTGPPVLSEGLDQPLTSPLRGRGRGPLREQGTNWKKANKELLSFKIVHKFFVCLVTVRVLLSSMAVLYHVKGPWF